MTAGGAPPTVTLVPMTSHELEAFIGEEIADCASAHLRDGSWPRRECQARARTELAGVTGCQRAAAAADTQRLLTARTQAGETVGWLWLKLPPAGPWTGSAFLCQMTVARAHRLRGYGRAMLAVLEMALAVEGLIELRLNVWEENCPAKALYDSAGYEVWQQRETMRQMRKRLEAPPAALPATEPAR